MAARLPLIVSQPVRGDRAAVDLIENIVAGAILVPRLDANLVGDISSIELGSTDHLCLQGHARDVILASYLELPAALAAWSRLGQAGCFIDCSLPVAEIRHTSRQAGNQRKIFFFQLSSQTHVPKLLDQCQELVNAQDSQLVTIQLQSRLQLDTHASLNSARAQQELEEPPVPASRDVPRSPAPNASPGHLVSQDQEDARQWSALDKLVDELDALDL